MHTPPIARRYSLCTCPATVCVYYLPVTFNPNEGLSRTPTVLYAFLSCRFPQ